MQMSGGVDVDVKILFIGYTFIDENQRHIRF